MQMSDDQLTKGASGTTVVMGYQYDRYDDGRVKFAQDLTATNSVYDRGYIYDQAGRLQEGKVGNEARGGSTANGPYRHTYAYDEWDNLVGRGGRNGVPPSATNINYTASYVNNRNAAWSYDEAGQVLVGDATNNALSIRCEQAWLM